MATVKYEVAHIELTLPAYNLPDGVPQSIVGKITLEHEDRINGFMTIKLETGPPYGPPPAKVIHCSVPMMAMLQAIDTLRKA